MTTPNIVAIMTALVFFARELTISDRFAELEKRIKKLENRNRRM